MLKEAGRTDDMERRLRASLARELHDGVLRDLTDCVVQLELLPGSGRHAELQPALAPLEQRTRSALEGVRHLIGELREEAPLDRSPVAVRRMLDGHSRSRRTGFLLFVSPTWPAILPRRVEVELLRILDEAAANAVRHAAARQVVVQLEATGDELIVEVDDDGRGIPESALRWPGQGILGMRERAAILGGRLSIRRLRSGTHLRLRVPVAIAGRARPAGSKAPVER